MSNVKAFNIWGAEGIKVEDIGLVDYITIEPKIVPKTGARYVGQKFHKSKTFIVERLINKLMIPGHKSKKHLRTSYHMTGKASNAYHIVKEAFKIVERKLKENPLKVFVKAIENAAPREEIITIEYGGARYPKATDCAPQRRVDIALRYMTQSSFQKSFNSKKHIVDALADEIIFAYQKNQASGAIAKKFEVERQSDSSR
ncbi:MAG: 30S ribosomal protein S7 [Candidatus Woesearchaeota archaeon]|nr:30S ribosomal protein S7 [Candidatus Woesearchaeota archaeon]